MLPSAPRYTQTPFPPYRFVPGRNPHPTADPAGHSYLPPNQPEPAAGVWIPPERWFESDDYLYGADLYNHAYWWEAHEAWEALWQLTDKSAPQGLFLQGLIQTSACHLKLFLNRRPGVQRLLESSTGYLFNVLSATGPARYMGLDIAAFLADVRAYYAPRLASDPLPGHDPREYPYVTLSRP